MITLEKAKKALVAAENKAKELGVTISTIIVDDHGMLIAGSHMDGALTISPKFAYAKAYSAASLRFATKDLAEYAGEGKPYYGINTLFSGEITIMAGGLPVKMGNRVVGGVGVGGSADTNQDVLCAEEAVKALTE